MFKRLLASLAKEGARVPNKTADAPLSITARQDKIVLAVLADRTELHDVDWEDREWVHIAVNHEMSIEDGRRSSSQTAVLAHKPGGELESLSFRLGMATKAMMSELREAMSDGDGTLWTIVDITIHRDGRYDFAFGYGPPPRINGDLLHRPLNGLLKRYKVEQGLQ